MAEEEIGHLCRSRLLDAFARLEVSLVDIIERADGVAERGGPLGAKLSKLQGVECRYKSPGKVADAREKIAKLVCIRGSIVHSGLDHAIRPDGSMVWIFKNVGQPSNGGHCMTGSDFAQMTQEVVQLSNRLKQMQLKPTPTAPATTIATAATR